MNAASEKRRFELYGYFGFAVIVLAEVLLFGGNDFVGHWFTPIVWTGYILLVDALVYKFKGRSLLMSNQVELIVIASISIGGWWLFEFYNAPRFWTGHWELWWHYHNLEPNFYLRNVGYDWAFATISPAMFETAELLSAIAFRKNGRRLMIRFSRAVLIMFVVLGLAGALLPILFPWKWFAPVIWLSFIFLLDPVNAWRGQPSITADLGRGDWRRLWSLLSSGLICGVLWEFWNYWAITKWTYTVPFFGNIKIFEMPVLGFLGFPPFAVECWVIYIFLRSLFQRSAAEPDSVAIHISSSGK